MPLIDLSFYRSPNREVRPFDATTIRAGLLCLKQRIGAFTLTHNTAWAMSFLDLQASAAVGTGIDEQPCYTLSMIQGHLTLWDSTAPKENDAAHHYDIVRATFPRRATYLVAVDPETRQATMIYADDTHSAIDRAARARNRLARIVAQAQEIDR